MSTKLVHLVFHCAQITVFVVIYKFGWGGSTYGAASEVRHIPITPKLRVKYEKCDSSKQA
jgi:hypothetical protein